MEPKAAERSADSLSSSLMQHGSQKLFGFPPSPQLSGPLPPLLLTAGVMEFFGGVLLLLGLFTRPPLRSIVGRNGGSLFQFARAARPLAVLNGGELSVLYCFCSFTCR
jgi:putative oxidoreductase